MSDLATFEWAEPNLNTGHTLIKGVPTSEGGAHRRIKEVAVDPEMIVGASDDFPAFVLLEIRHPRHGDLTFLIPRSKAPTLGAAIQAT